jgi:uncharacterized ion transporter superfamily protein YfcC
MSDSLKSKKFTMPHVYILLMGFILVCAILSWILPHGAYERVEMEVNGRVRNVVNAQSFNWIETAPEDKITGIGSFFEAFFVGKGSKVGLFDAFMAVFNGMVNAADIVFFIFISFAAVNCFIESGMFHGMIAGLARKLKGKSRVVFIPIFLALLGLCSSTFGLFEEALPFIPVFVGMSVALGFDALVGLAIVAVGIGMGYSGAAMNPFTVQVAQGIAELPLMSGAIYRVICHLAMLAVASVYIIRYAHKVQANPKASYCYGQDLGELNLTEDSLSQHEFGVRQKIVSLWFLITIVCFILGVYFLHWYFGEIATFLLVMSIGVAVIMKWSPNNYANRIAASFTGAATACLMVGIARGIMMVLQQGQIIDTVVYGLAYPLSGLPTIVAAEAMLILETILNFFIPSGSGQAMAVMPIMAPLADVLGLSRQVAVLAYQFGDGFSNIMWPTAFAVVMAGIAKVKVTQWWRFLVPLFGLILLTQGVLMAIAVIIGF